jgi:hypothetical protein
MAIDLDVARAARNLIIEHGAAAKTIALARAKHAEESNQPAAAHTWRNIAAAVKRLQGRPDPH